MGFGWARASVGAAAAFSCRGLDLGWIGAGFVSPARRCSASAGGSQWPCLLIPMGMTSYLVRSMDLRMLAAERRETSCSPERPPKRIPTRNFFLVCFFVMGSFKFLAVLVCRPGKKFESG